MTVDLSILPKKTAAKFNHMLEHKHIAESDVQLICDAAKMNPKQISRIEQFSLSLLAMRSQGVHIADTIKMAQQLGRPVNFLWSSARWQSEHNRLSRLSTARNLREKNVDFDLSWIEKKLLRSLNSSNKWYLIKNSFRLGMEGLRQDHCVASYTDRIFRKECAIGSAILDGCRWTLEFVVVDDQVYLVTCLTKRNKRPSEETIRKIEDIVGVKYGPEKRFDSVMAIRNHDRRDEDEMKALTLAVFQFMIEEQIDTIEAMYSGGGDSGDYGGFYALQDHKNISVDSGHTIQYNYGGEVRNTTIGDAIYRVSESHVDACGTDWYNNEGGFCNFTFQNMQNTLEHCYISFDSNYYTQESHLDEQYEHNLLEYLSENND